MDAEERTVGMSPYVAGLRDLVGTRLLLLPSVAVLPVSERGVMLVQNADDGLWQTIGGALDPDETPEAGAIREMHEETGLHVELTGLLGVVAGPECRTVYPNGDQMATMTAVYQGRITSGELTLQLDEVTAHRWVKPADLSALDLTRHAAVALTHVGLMGAKA